ncbi:hypothetical protein [Streptomyces sp. NPDC059631]|uniref:hypothetical protein n=1 Tax=unclassified Streptomyces TaxID=2593676 RepID=UPI0036C2D91B
MVGTYFPGRGTLFEETYLEGKAEGEAEGRTTLILRALEKRGIEVSSKVRDRVVSCTDLAQLTIWFDRSLTAESAADLFIRNPEDSELAALTLRILDKRGIDVPHPVRRRITSCTDLDQLTTWFDRALTAEAADDLFAEPAD